MKITKTEWLWADMEEWDLYKITITREDSPITINNIWFTLVCWWARTTKELLEYFMPDIKKHKRLKHLDFKDTLLWLTEKN